jgi:predicted HTH domain antitoxin
MIADQPALVDEWLVDELPRLYRERPTLLRAWIERLLGENEELRWSLVVQAYQEQRINLGKAAELLDMPEVDLRQRFTELGIPLRLGPADLEEAQAEVKSVRAWYRREEPRRP